MPGFQSPGTGPSTLKEKTLDLHQLSGSCGGRAKLAFVLALGVVGTVPVFAQASGQADRVRSLNNDLLRIHAEAQGVPSQGLTALRDEAAPVIAQRAAALSALIQDDPAEALKVVLSPELVADLVAKFPASAAQLETHGTWAGPVEQWVMDHRDGTHQTVTRMLAAGGQTLEVHFAGLEPKNIKCGETLQATGVVVGATLLAYSTTVQPVPTTTTSTATASSVCTTTGPQSTVVLMVTFPGVTPPSYTTSQSVHDAFFGTAGYSLDGYWREASYGKASATGDVFGWYTLSTAYTCSSTDNMRAEAITVASNAGVNFQNYTRLFIVVPDMGCGWSGAATMACSSLSAPTGSFTASTSYINWTEWGNGSGTNNAATVIMHEGGHNLGLNHSRSRAFGTEALGALGTTGTLGEYGDGFTAMSNGGPGHYDAPHKAELLNWLASSNFQVVQGSGTWTLAPLETPSPGLQALKIQRGTGNNAWLWVEYRQPVGNYDVAYANGNVWSNQVFSGAVIHYEDPITTNAYSDLLDYTPTSSYGFYDPALAAGQTWVDPYSNVSITVNSAASSGLNLSVNYGAATCTHANPMVTMSPANPSVAPGSSVPYTVSVTNSDSSGCSASTFNLTSSQPSGWLGAYSAPTLTINPGQSATVTLTETVPASAAPATYALGGTATSTSFTGSATANATVAALSTLTDTTSVPGSSYSPRQTVQVKAMVMNGSVGAAGASVTFTLTKSNGSKATATATADSTGAANWSYKINPKDPAGSYGVMNTASFNSNSVSSNTATFTVQ